MSHVDAGPLAGYNSLMDPHLSGFFCNSRMKKHLVKSGLITKNGHIVSENTYRLNMARKEHKKHVRDMLAQAIVHKTLDMERGRQVAIKQKLEEIAKIELVRRVKSECNRKGDEDLLPYLEPSKKGDSRSRSRSRRSSEASGRGKRPKSAPSQSRHGRNRSRDYDDDSRDRRDRYDYDDHSSQRSRPQSGSSNGSARPKSSRKGRAQSSKYPRGEVDDKHLYSLDQTALHEYTMGTYNMDSNRGPSPYTYSQLPPEMMPTPPQTPRDRGQHHHRRGGGGTSGRQSQNKNRQSQKNNPDSPQKGYLMLHRLEPAMKHQDRVQTLCDVSMRYSGPSIKLDYERFDPRDEVMIEQQHCGGNTLIVYRERIVPGSCFTFTSRRHRGYPFSLTLYVNGIQYCRLSTCCEYKHPSGSRLGGSQGYFIIEGIEGAQPCYKCQCKENSKDKKKKQQKKKKRRDSSSSSSSSSSSDNGGYSSDSDHEEDRDQLEQDPGVKVPVEEDDVYSSDSDHSRRSSTSSSSSSSASSKEETKTEEKPKEEKKKEEKPPGEREWSVKVYTSDVDRAGTDANVTMVMYGKKDGKVIRSDEVVLDNEGNNFERKKCDQFKVEFSDVGKPYKLRIGQDGSGSLPGWHLDRVEMEHLRSKKRYTFPCNRWLADDEDDGATFREIPAEGDDIRQPEELVKYEVSVYTGKTWGAGTDANVFINLFGENGESGDRQLSKSQNNKNKFEKGNMDKFSIEAVGLKKLEKIRVGHDGQNAGDGWFLDKIAVKPSNDPKGQIVFQCHRWLDVKEDDGQIVRDLTVEDSVSQYSVKVYTGKKSGAGTDANVFINIYGEEGDTGEIPLAKSKTNKNKFEKGKMDEFVLDADDLGKLQKISIGHDGINAGNGWYLDKVVVTPKLDPKDVVFPCDRWLDVKEDDGQIVRELYPEGTRRPVKDGMTRWSVKVYTSDTAGAGTNSNVHMVLFGKDKDGNIKETESVPLDNKGDNFEQGACDNFEVDTIDIGNPYKMRIGQDGSGSAAGWRLDRVELENVSNNKKYMFVCNRWLDKNEDDGATTREIPAEGDDITAEQLVRYAISVHTADIQSAGTDADVFIKLIGEQGDSGEQFLTKSQNNSNKFERGNVDEFTLESVGLKELKKISIGHRSKKVGSGWFLDKVIVKPSDGQREMCFECGRWLDLTRGDRKSVMELSPKDPEPEGDTSGTIPWYVKIYTSDIANAGTDADVCLLLYGKNSDGETVESDEITLDNKENNFEQGRCDGFEIQTADIGKPFKLRIGQTGSGAAPGWHLDRVELENLSNKKKYIFACNRWLDENEDDGATFREIPAEGDDIQKPAKLIKYVISVHTGNTWGAGTDSNVYINIIGDQGETAKRQLTRSNNRNKFERGNTDVFSVEAIDLGKLQKVCIGHDGQNAGAGWYLDKVVISASNGVQDTFECSKWLDVNEGDGLIERELTPSNDDLDKEPSKVKFQDDRPADKSVSSTADSKPDNDKSRKKRRRKTKKSTSSTSSARSSSSSSFSSSGSGSSSSGSSSSSSSVASSSDSDSASRSQKVASPATDQKSKTEDTAALSTADDTDATSSTRQHTTDGEDRAGGHDPDNVAGDTENPRGAVDLSQMSISPGERYEGSIRPLVGDDKSNIEIISFQLNKDQVNELCELIQDHGEIESLVLRSTGLDDNDVEKLAAVMATTPDDDLQMLNLNCNAISASGAHHIVSVIKNKPNLELLLLHNSPLGDLGIYTLVQGILEVSGKLSSVDDAQIQQAAQGIVRNVLQHAIESTSAAQEQNDGDATENKSRSGSDASTGKTATENPKPVTNQDDNVSATKLEHLDIGDCQISDRGIQAVAALVRADTAINTLCLTGNKGVGPRGWNILGESLQENHNLETLTLDYNTLGDEGVIAFIKGIQGNSEGSKKTTALKSLDLEGNKIGDLGGAKILELVQECPSLNDVTLMPGNHISASLLENIRKILSARE